jgi:hypothetical protein
MKKVFMVMLSMFLVSAVAGSIFAQNAGTYSSRASLPSGQFGEFQGQPLLGVNEIVGKQALSADGKQLGTIQNVLISSNGREAYIMMSGQRLGKSGQFIPVPWVMAQPGIWDGNVILQLTEQTLRQAPGISASQAYRVGQILPQINSYYGGFQGEMMGQGASGPGYGSMGYGYGPGFGYGPCFRFGYGPGYGMGYGHYPGTGMGYGGTGYYPGMGYGTGTGYYPYDGMEFGDMSYGTDNY